MSVDLHIHSAASDGLHASAELVTMAAGLGLSAIAITDHDCVDGVDEALAASAGLGLRVLPALELSSHIGQRDVHFLGYHIDHHNVALAAHLEELRDARLERAGEMIDLLRHEGMDVSLDELLDVAGKGAVGRAHMATLLTKKGYASSVADAFERFLQRGACCYLEKEVMAPERVIELIRQTGGVPVLAHPGVSRVDEHIERLAAVGIEGIEAFHADHSLEQMQRYRALADRLGLVVTGGSDFHGESVRGLRVGAVEVPDWVVDALDERAGRGR